jgi:hypothetical protein
VSWGDVPTSFASFPSSIGPILELFTFLAPRPLRTPRPPHKPCISLISLCTRVKSLLCGFEPGGSGIEPRLGTFFDQKNRTRKVDPPSAGASWGDVPTSFASSSSSIGPNLELFTFLAPRPPQGPQATLRSLIRLVSLCISLQKPYKPYKPRFEPTLLGPRVVGSSLGGRKS